MRWFGYVASMVGINECMILREENIGRLGMNGRIILK
jgi:hypothetical protein